MLNTNTILLKHYLDYLNIKNSNNKLISHNLSDLEVQNLYNKFYNLSEFDIYKYITAYDYINESLGCEKYKLTEGITLEQNKYNNILIDLFYKNISSDIINQYPISMVFGIKQTDLGIKDLTKKDLYN